MGAKKRSSEIDFEETYPLKDFSLIIKKPERFIENIRDHHGLPSYKEGRKVTYKVSDYEKWREERKQIKS